MNYRIIYNQKIVNYNNLKIKYIPPKKTIFINSLLYRFNFKKQPKNKTINSL